MVKTNCFGYEPTTERCKVLKYVVCKKRECTFFKPKGTECVGCLYEHKAANIKCKDCRWSANKEVKA